MIFVHKTTYLAWANIRLAMLHGLARLADIRQAMLHGLARLADIRQPVLLRLARLADICQSPYTKDISLILLIYCIKQYVYIKDCDKT